MSDNDSTEQDFWPVSNLADLTAANVNFYEDEEYGEGKTRFMQLIHNPDNDGAEDHAQVVYILEKQLLTPEQFAFKTKFDGNFCHWLFLNIYFITRWGTTTRQDARQALQSKLEELERGLPDGEEVRLPVVEAVQLVEEVYVAKATRPAVERVKRMARALFDPAANPYIRKKETVKNGADENDGCSSISRNVNLGNGPKFPTRNDGLLFQLLAKDKAYVFSGPATYVKTALSLMRAYCPSAMLSSGSDEEVLAGTPALASAGSSQDLPAAAGPCVEVLVRKWLRGRESRRRNSNLVGDKAEEESITAAEVLELVDNCITMIPASELLDVFENELDIDIGVDLRRREKYGLDEEERAAAAATKRRCRRGRGSRGADEEEEEEEDDDEEELE